VNEGVRLYVIPGSHPCATVERALQIKGIPYERVDLLPGLSQLTQRVMFGRRTVPGLRVGKRDRVIGSRLILRAIDAMVPEPPLLPADPEQRARVEAAEEWGEMFQNEARPIALSAIVARPDCAGSFLEEVNLPLPDALARPATGPVFWAELRLLGFTPARVRELIAALPGRLDEIDALIGDGVIGDASRPNVADLQIGGSLALLRALDDVKPLLEGRPCGALTEQLFPDFHGRVPSGAIEVPALAAA
jgi:glutathione S-transferase